MNLFQQSWAPDYLVKAYFSQTDEWITAAGQRLKVAEMDLPHCLNCILFLERVADDLPFPRAELQRQALYAALYDRVLKALQPPTEAVESDDLHPTMVGTTPDDIRYVLREAARSHRSVRLTYTSSLTGKRSTRDLYSLSDPSDKDVLFARQVSDSSTRTFVIRNIEHVELI